MFNQPKWLENVILNPQTKEDKRKRLFIIIGLVVVAVAIYFTFKKSKA